MLQKLEIDYCFEVTVGLKLRLLRVLIVSGAALQSRWGQLALRSCLLRSLPGIAGLRPRLCICTGIGRSSRFRHALRTKLVKCRLFSTSRLRLAARRHLLSAARCRKIRALRMSSGGSTGVSFLILSAHSSGHYCHHKWSLKEADPSQFAADQSIRAEYRATVIPVPKRWIATSVSGGRSSAIKEAASALSLPRSSSHRSLCLR